MEALADGRAPGNGPASHVFLTSPFNTSLSASRPGRQAGKRGRTGRRIGAGELGVFDLVGVLAGTELVPQRGRGSTAGPPRR